jgi:hypothetical protein
VLRPLSDDAPDHVECVWPLIGLLVAVRRLDPEDVGVPLARSFGPFWCGCDEQTWRRALAWLQRHRYVGLAGQVDVGKRKPMNLWWIAEQPS